MQGFADVVHAMDRRYPAAMMLDLRMHSQAALRDAACGFREAQVTAAQQRNLDAFQQARPAPARCTCADRASKMVVLMKLDRARGRQSAAGVCK